MTLYPTFLTIDFDARPIPIAPTRHVARYLIATSLGFLFMGYCGERGEADRVDFDPEHVVDCERCRRALRDLERDAAELAKRGARGG